MEEHMIETAASVTLPAPGYRRANPGTWTVRGELWARVHPDGTLEVNGMHQDLPFEQLTPNQVYAVLMALLAARSSQVSADVADWWYDGDWRSPDD
jgi:hypothetical protein